MNTKIIIEINDCTSVINHEVDNRLYPVATIDKDGKVVIDDRTKLERVFSIGNVLHTIGLLLLVGYHKRNLTQNKPQDK